MSNKWTLKQFINKFKLKIYWVLAQDMIVYLGFILMSDSSQEMTSSLCSILLSY